MKYDNMTLSVRNKFLQDNVKALIWFWADLYANDEERYEELADGLETVHKMLLHSRSNFRTARGAARACFNMVVAEMSHIDRCERPGFEAARVLFDNRLVRPK